MYNIIQSKVGWIVQNSRTYLVVAGPYATKQQAENVVAKLSK